MNNQFFIGNLWRWKCGLSERESLPSFYDDLKLSEWSPEFEQLMRNRLIFGAYRYGLINGEYKPKYDRVGSIISRVKKYYKTGNKEYLIDAANLCLLEFVECKHPKQHFESIDDGEHVNIK